MRSTGELRDINRHSYMLDAARIAMAQPVVQPVVQRLLALMRLRTHHPAFDGEFELRYSNDTSVDLGWRNGDHACHALIDLRFRTTTVTHSDPVGGGEISFRA